MIFFCWLSSLWLAGNNFYRHVDRIRPIKSCQRNFHKEHLVKRFILLDSIWLINQITRRRMLHVTNNKPKEPRGRSRNKAAKRPQHCHMKLNAEWKKKRLLIHDQLIVHNWAAYVSKSTLSHYLWVQACDRLQLCSTNIYVRAIQLKFY